MQISALSEAIPGKPFYAVKEINKTTVKLNVAPDGKLSELEVVLPRGENITAVNSDGNLYIADTQIFVYDKSYCENKMLTPDERPISIAIGGSGQNILFVTKHSALYGIRIR